MDTYFALQEVIHFCMVLLLYNGDREELLPEIPVKSGSFRLPALNMVVYVCVQK